MERIKKLLLKALGMRAGFRIGGTFTVVCKGPDGRVKWTETAHNLVTNVGLNHILDVILHGSSQVSTWYVGLKNTGAPAAADTLASHSGWTENENYSEATRPAYVEAAASSQSITNSASPAEFSINADSQTIAGAFLASDSTKGGTTGTLLCAVNFSSARSADNGDTLQVTYTISAADDGS